MIAGERREMVLQAALTEFAARGLDGTSTQAIARRAGISQPYLFRLFPTKKALFLSVVQQCFQQVTQALATAAAGLAGEDALQAMGCAFGQLCQLRTLPLVQLHAYAACTDPDIRAATRAAYGDLRDSIEWVTGLPPARVQRWLGTGLLMTAATAMNLQVACTKPKTASQRRPRCIPRPDTNWSRPGSLTGASKLSAMPRPAPPAGPGGRGPR